MPVQVLEQLKSEEFVLSAGFLATPAAVRRYLFRTQEVRGLREALRQGSITEDTVRRFVSALMGDFRRGERFPHELALAALAAVLETWFTDFADEFLRDLSRLPLAELSLCVRVARECLKRRASMAGNQTRTINLLQAGNGASLPAFSTRRSLSAVNAEVSKATIHCGAV